MFLIVPWTIKLVALIVDVVKEFTFAIVSYKGNPKLLMIFHVFVSRDTNESVVKAWDVLILLVPSEKNILFVVLTIIDCGDDRYPRLSRIVTFRPGGIWLDNNTMADAPDVKSDVSRSTTDVLGFTIYVLISIWELWRFLQNDMRI